MGLFHSQTRRQSRHMINSYNHHLWMIRFASLLQFEKLFDELSPHLEDILAANHLGVAVALAESCQKLGVKQGKFKNVSQRIFFSYLGL